jgi:hypothetical protein
LVSNVHYFEPPKPKVARVEKNARGSADFFNSERMERRGRDRLCGVGLSGGNHLADAVDPIEDHGRLGSRRFFSSGRLKRYDAPAIREERVEGKGLAQLEAFGKDKRT